MKNSSSVYTQGGEAVKHRFLHLHQDSDGFMSFTVHTNLGGSKRWVSDGFEQFEAQNQKPNGFLIINVHTLGRAE